jgi:hypothetical protein
LLTLAARLRPHHLRFLATGTGDGALWKKISGKDVLFFVEIFCAFFSRLPELAMELCGRKFCESFFPDERTSIF